MAEQILLFLQSVTGMILVTAVLLVLLVGWLMRRPTFAWTDFTYRLPLVGKLSRLSRDQPTVAISGEVKTLAETFLRSRGVTASPRKCHMAIRPCMAATLASMKTPVQSPAA